jgi:hypothetical protein
MNPVAQKIQHPNYVIGADGQAVAVLVDIATWQAIIRQLEDLEDVQVLETAAADLTALAHNQYPSGWKSWEEFEAELDVLETADENCTPASTLQL